MATVSEIEKLKNQALDLAEALREFVDEYGTDPDSWPDDMVEKLTTATAALKAYDGD